jgi:hypothetical protein
MARDEALATPQVRYVLLDGSNAPSVIGNALLIDSEALFEIPGVFKRVFNRFKTLGKKINPAANPSESDHKSDKENGGIKNCS